MTGRQIKYYMISKEPSHMSISSFSKWSANMSPTKGFDNTKNAWNPLDPNTSRAHSCPQLPRHQHCIWPSRYTIPSRTNMTRTFERKPLPEEVAQLLASRLRSAGQQSAWQHLAGQNCPGTPGYEKSVFSGPGSPRRIPANITRVWGVGLCGTQERRGATVFSFCTE